MKTRQLIITLAIILCASTSWAMRPGFWGAIVAGGGVLCDSGIVVNGCFDDGDTGWTYDVGASFVVADGAATLGNNGGTYKVAYSTASPAIVAEQTYYWSINIMATTGWYRLVIGAVDVLVDYEPGQKSGTVTTINNWAPVIKVDSDSPGATITFDDLKVWQ